MSILTKFGKVRVKFKPAIYFDANVLIEYYLSEGFEDDSWKDDIFSKNQKRTPKLGQLFK